jgi:AcrR family transcriptional regulator
MEERIVVKRAPRDPEATRRRILDAALEEFSAKGIAGARVDAIAERAGVNKAMLYYYFGSKDGLFREVLGQPVATHVDGLRSDDVTSADRLVVRSEDLAPDPSYVRLLAWEGLEADPADPADAELRREFFAAWVRTVEDAQRAGDLPADLDASQLVFAEICLVLGPLILPQVARLVTGLDVDDPRFGDERRRFLESVTRRLDHQVPAASSSRR